MDDRTKQKPYRRQLEEAKRTINEWPEWMKRKRDAVHVPIREPKDQRAEGSDSR